MYRSRPVIVIAVLVAATLSAICFAIVTGPADISLGQIWAALASNEPTTARTIVMSIRMPRAILAAMVGGILSITGIVFQALFRNPLADPYLVGVYSGAGLGATLAISLGISVGGMFSAVPLFAFAGATIATYLAYRLARFGSMMSVSSLLLAGIAISSFFNAIISVLMVFSTRDLHAMIFWLMGGFSASSWNRVLTVLPWFLVIPVIMTFSKDLNVLLLGDEKAQTLGVDTERTKKLLLGIASLISAAAVSVSGIIGFIGLVVPHMVRIIIGPDHRLLIPASVLVGASVLVLADTAARTVFGSFELPVGVVTAFFGAPFFIYLLRTRKQVYF